MVNGAIKQPSFNGSASSVCNKLIISGVSGFIEFYTHLSAVVWMCVLGQSVNAVV